ncbi:uncharacterized membrane protein YkvA (DUF1232 family) [Tepidamorphus gemmatus]|uniref:Uncharacterized membrane protein YkvA (DUF1232 family) n=1 Tax=Tepidamorphus gemmatus TaxID=747076 RepID=A0A4R3MF62_9HYPH|nr:YkvA family protein [Tepidamorphus gemmatus]TCT11703.1 uncharacterized membrane protein YkvA (DUF1232 family) [Tepidamorphus gemmatus]
MSTGDISQWTSAEMQLPTVAAANERRVRGGFWPKLRRHAARLPFAHDLVAAWYCATDPATPFRVRAVLFGALAYFVIPVDTVPDLLAVVGLSDDASVLLAALTVVGAHITPNHREKAAATLRQLDR